MKRLPRKTSILLLLLVSLVAGFVHFSKSPTGLNSICLIADASEYNPIAPKDATYTGRSLVLEEELIQKIRESFEKVDSVPPQLSAPAWFLLYFGDADINDGVSFVFASDGSHAFAYRARFAMGKITIESPPWGKLENANALVSQIEPTLRAQFPQLASHRFDPQKWRE